MGAKNLKPFTITWLEVLLVWNVPKFYTDNEVLKVLNILGVLEDNQVSIELNFWLWHYIEYHIILHKCLHKPLRINTYFTVRKSI